MPAQQSPSRPLIGLLSPLSPATAARNVEAFRKGLHDLGYVEGRNIVLELRFAEGIQARLPQLAAELVALKPDVILAGSEPGIRAAHNATRSIPLVMITGEDPVHPDWSKAYSGQALMSLARGWAGVRGSLASGSSCSSEPCRVSRASLRWSILTDHACVLL
jgi:hypothetical protein